jgi:type I restriction enzyme, S subunit
MSIPETWTTILLERIVLDTQPGFAQRPNRENIGIPQIRTNNISIEGALDLSEIKYVKADNLAIEKYGVQKGDIIFNNTNSPELVGKTALFDLDTVYVISNHMTRIRVNSEIVDSEYLARYLHYLWQTGASRSWARQWVNQAAIDQASLRRFDVILPPRSEQRQIANILHQADTLYQWRQAANRNVEALINALFNAQFAEFKKFEWRPLSEVCEYITKGTTPKAIDISESKKKDNDVPFIKVHHIEDDGDIEFEAKPAYVSQELHNGLLNRSKIFPNDILMNIVGPPLGKIGIVPNTHVEWNTNQAIAIFRCKDEIEPLYLFYSLRSQYILPKILRLAVGVRQLNISLAQCREIEIPVPDIKIQRDFVNKIQEIRRIKESQRSSLLILRELRSSLYARAFTGEVTLSWRMEHQDQIRLAAWRRDNALREYNAETKPVETSIESLSPEETERLRQVLGNFAVNIRQMQERLVQPVQQMTQISREIVKSLEQMNRNLVEPALQSIRQSMQTMQTIASIKLPAIDNETILRNIDALPVGQDQRAIMKSLDITNLRVLKLAGTYPAYFTAEDLETGEIGGITTLQAEASLRVLQALGFVKFVQVNGFLRYRLTEETDYVQQSTTSQP